MGMSTHVVGFRPPDEKWKKMKKIWDSCQEAGVAVPKEVAEFFDDCEPDPAGVEVEIKTHPYHDESRDGYEVHLSEIPKDVTLIRFFNSY
jgi:hypothetical protein